MDRWRADANVGTATGVQDLCNKVSRRSIPLVPDLVVGWRNPLANLYCGSHAKQATHLQLRVQFSYVCFTHHYVGYVQMRKTTEEYLALALAGIGGVGCLLVVITIPWLLIMFAWNVICPPLLGWPEITFIQAIGLSILTGILGKMIGGRKQ
jgi:hypothetical protein